MNKISVSFWIMIIENIPKIITYDSNWNPSRQIAKGVLENSSAKEERHGPTGFIHDKFLNFASERAAGIWK